MLFKAHLPICERMHITSSTVHLDKAYDERIRLAREKYRTEGMCIDDPEENQLHEGLRTLKVIMTGQVKRTRDAQGATAG